MCGRTVWYGGDYRSGNGCGGKRRETNTIRRYVGGKKNLFLNPTGAIMERSREGSPTVPSGSQCVDPLIEPGEWSIRAWYASRSLLMLLGVTLPVLGDMIVSEIGKEILSPH